MNVFKKIFIIFIVIFSFDIKSQIFNWNVNFEQIFDNREYARNIGNSETILGGRFSTELGLNYDSSHFVYVGFNSLYEYGNELSSQTSKIILYYKYTNNKNFNIYLGAFSRKNLIDNYPLVILSDFFSYYNPTLTGGLFDFSNSYGHQNIWCDWISRQTETKREMFMAGTSGKQQFSRFYIENYMYMFHKALPKENKDSIHISDIGVGSLFIGYDMSELTIFNNAKIDFGYILSYNRERPKSFIFNNGLMIRLFLEYKNYGLNITKYCGDPISLPHGDPLYRNENYARIDLYWMPIIKNKNISSKINLAFHIEDGKIGNSQQLFLYIKFESIKNRLDNITEKFGKKNFYYNVPSKSDN